MYDSVQQSSIAVVPRGIVIMVEDVHKVSEEVINKVMEVEEMVKEAGVTRNQTEK